MDDKREYIRTGRECVNAIKGQRLFRIKIARIGRIGTRI